MYTLNINGFDICFETIGYFKSLNWFDYLFSKCPIKDHTWWVYYFIEHNFIKRLLVCVFSLMCFKFIIFVFVIYSITFINLNKLKTLVFYTFTYIFYETFNKYLKIDVNGQFLWYYVLWLYLALFNSFSLLPKITGYTTILIVPVFFSFWIFFLNNFKEATINTENWLLHFLPGRLSHVLSPGIIYIELISYVMRPFSLSLRLFANILSGHILIHIVSGYCWLFFNNKFTIFFIVTISSLIILNFLEYFFAVVQSFVFILISIITHQDTLKDIGF